MCAGASLLDDLEGMLQDAGFVDIRIQPKDEEPDIYREVGSRNKHWLIT